MKTFTIDAENNITIHASRQAARENGSPVFATQAQFAELIGPDTKRLIEIWNSLTGVKPVKKFKDRKAAIERIWKAIQSLGQATPTEANKPPAVEIATETLSEINGAPVLAATTMTDLEPAPVVNETETEPEVSLPAIVAPHSPDVAQPEVQTKRNGSRGKKAPQALTTANDSRPASKTATIVALLQQPGGTTLHAIMDATSWQAHSVRGFISGTLGKRMGLTVVSSKSENGERTYSIQA